MEWVDFMFKVAGRQFVVNNRIIPKYIVFDRIVQSKRFKDDPSYLDNILKGESEDYDVIDSEFWKDGKCFFNYEIHSVTGLPYKNRTLFETA